MLISIIGTSAVGKSFLVKQLASFAQWPAFFEGEEGTIPDDIMESIFDNKNPSVRHHFFLSRHKNNLENAKMISDIQNVFVDGAHLTSKVALTYEQDKSKTDLRRLIKEYDHPKSDLYVLLTADVDCLIRHFKARSRKTDNIDKALKRALFLQDSFLEIIRTESDTIIIDRSDLDFTRYKDVKYVFDKIQDFK